jgi:hypothetical protein
LDNSVSAVNESAKYTTWVRRAPSVIRSVRAARLLQRGAIIGEEATTMSKTPIRPKWFMLLVLIPFATSACGDNSSGRKSSSKTQPGSACSSALQ